MLTWAGTPLLPQQNIPPSCPLELWTGRGGQAEGRCILVTPSPWWLGPGASPVLPTLRSNTNSSRKPSRLIHKGFAVLPSTQHIPSLNLLNYIYPSFPCSPITHHLGLAWVSALPAVAFPQTLTPEPLDPGTPSSAQATGRLGNKKVFKSAQNSVQVTEHEEDQQWEVTSDTI